MIKYTLQMVVLGSDGSVQPISVLDKHRMNSNPNQIGRRYWDEKWDSWGYEILDVKPGTDVTGFIGG